MADAVTFTNMPRSKPKTIAEGKEQLSSSLARMASTSASGGGIPITEVGFGQCRFVIDDRTFPAVCCGEPTLGGSWCAQHRALVFVRVAVQPNGRRPLPDASKPPAAEPAKEPARVLAKPTGKAALTPGTVPAAVVKPPEPSPVVKAKAPSTAKASAPKPSSPDGKASSPVKGKKAEPQSKEGATPAKATKASAPAAVDKGAGTSKTSADRGKAKTKVQAAGKRGPAARS